MRLSDGRRRGWDGTASDIGLGVSPCRGMPQFSVGFSQKGRKKMFYEQSVIRNSKHALSSGLTVLAGLPVPVQTAPAEKPGNPGKVRTALLNLEAFFLYHANICPYLTFQTGLNHREQYLLLTTDTVWSRPLSGGLGLILNLCCFMHTRLRLITTGLAVYDIYSQTMLLSLNPRPATTQQLSPDFLFNIGCPWQNTQNTVYALAPCYPHTP